LKKQSTLLTVITAVSMLVIFACPSGAAQVKTALFAPSRDNCPEEVAASFESRLARTLGRARKVDLLDKSAVLRALDNRPCSDVNCAMAACKKLGALRAVTVKISGDSTEQARTMGKEGKEQYLIKVSRKQTYRITVMLWDAESRRRLGRFSKTADDDTLAAAADYLAEKVAALYGDEKKKAATAKPGSAAGSAVRGVLGLSPSCIIPLGDFTDIAGPGGGFYLYGGVMNALFDNSVILVSTGFWYLSERGDAKSLYTTQVSLALGYNFILPKNFTLEPLFGFGYHFHVLERESAGTYADPFVSVRCEGAYLVYPSLYLTLAPAYTVYFEKAATGMYLTVEAGLKYLF